MIKNLLTLKFLEGKRTVIGALIIALLTFLKIMGVVDEKTYAEAVGFLTAIGLVTAAVHKPPV